MVVCIYPHHSMYHLAQAGQHLSKQTNIILFHWSLHWSSYFCCFWYQVVRNFDLISSLFFTRLMTQKLLVSFFQLRLFHCVCVLWRWEVNCQKQLSVIILHPSVFPNMSKNLCWFCLLSPFMPLFGCLFGGQLTHWRHMVIMNLFSFLKEKL
jgi:hypothetical protein